jgi:hypothetical protein
MGYGNYDKDAYREITTTRVDKPKEEIFTERRLNAQMNPKGVKVRESRDSANHPNSIGIIFALDETGSMQGIPDYLVREGMPGFMELLIDGKFVDDPQVMCIGIGDATTGEPAPLQVGQFEAEAELMDKWLTSIYLVGNGGGNGGESYDLAFYFAARHTNMDCWEKRKKKGYLFVTGDEPHLDLVEAQIVRDLCGDDVRQDIPMKKIVEEASKTYHCFFLIPDQGRLRASGCEASWRPVLGDNVICMDTEQDTAIVAATLIGLTEGTLADLNEAAEKLKALGKPQDVVARVIRTVTPYAKTLGRGKGGSRQDEDGDEPTQGKNKGKGGKRPGRF